jgi:dienelactone hydrolase
MIDPPPSELLYLPCDHGPVFVDLHRPATGAAQTAVMFCPPFGWEEVCSYRSLRFWATRLAAAGYPALRVTLPGTGDSAGGPQDPGLIGQWIAAVITAAAWLRNHVQAPRIVGVGIGMGGLIVALATAAGAPIDDLALWATPARGRRLLRELRTFAEFERAQIYSGAAAPAPAAGLETGGFLVSQETMEAIAAIDLRTLTLPAADTRHALLLDRDGVPFDHDLRQRLTEQGVTVTDAPGGGFGDMTSHPQRARPPREVIARFTDWVGALPAEPVLSASARPGTPSSPPAEPDCELRVEPGGRRLRETAVSIRRQDGRLTAILCEPSDGPSADTAVILLNAGAVRRIGPNRMWVEAARRWAAQGVATLRLDAEGLGDSDGDETPYSADAALYAPQFTPQVLSAMDFLQARGVAQRFVVGGLCAGASWALHASLLDARVSGLLLLNPRVLIWSDDLGPARDLRALLSHHVSLARIRRQARGARLSAFLLWAGRAPIRRLRRSATTGVEPSLQEMLAGITNLSATGSRLLWVFSDGEPLYDELTRSGFLDALAAGGAVSVERIHVRDHTLRPGWAQREAHRALDAALTAALAGDPAGSKPLRR